MTPADGLAVAGGLIAASAILAWLMSWNFCTEPSPRWLRSWRDVALAGGGAHLVHRGLAGGEPDWWGAAIWLVVAAFGVAIAIWNINRALIVGDRCPWPKEGDPDR